MPKKKTELTGTVTHMTDPMEAVRKFASTIGVAIPDQKETDAREETMRQATILAEQTGNLKRMLAWKKAGKWPEPDMIIEVWMADIKASLEAIKKLHPGIYEKMLTTKPNDLGHGALFREIMSR